MSPIAGDAGKLLTVNEFHAIISRVAVWKLLRPQDMADLHSLSQHDVLSRQRILWLERENEELRYHLRCAQERYAAESTPAPEGWDAEHPLVTWAKGRNRR